MYLEVDDLVDTINFDCNDLCFQDQCSWTRIQMMDNNNLVHHMAFYNALVAYMELAVEGSSTDRDYDNHN